ncbi:MAG: hypothetical protein N3B16_06160, partial [Candidatus Aminicenantes bacterium]|nr:hypothetical protein [Candidatus Aminicenantes bacterium]
MAIAGYHGRVLELDLSTGETKVVPLQADDVMLYLGGRGLGTKLLYDRMDPKADPLGPDNVIVIATSPLIGSQAPTAARGHMVYKSSLTGYFGTSNSGGAWAYGFKAAGYYVPIFYDCTPSLYSNTPVRQYMIKEVKMISTIQSIVTILLSVIAIILSIIFYFKSTR